MPQINQAGLELIKNFESCRLEAYDDGTGTWTIGWGHTPATPGEVWTQEQADAQLEWDLSEYEQCVNEMVFHSINPNQFAALVSFAYNLGCEALRDSTLMRYVNADDYAAAQAEFGKWIYAGGQELEGLVRRRAAEAALFGEPT